MLRPMLILWGLTFLVYTVGLFIIPMPGFFLFGAVGNGVLALEDLLMHAWIGAVISAANALFCLWMWWRRGGKRKLRALGEKSRALLARLIERMNDRIAPQPA